MASLSFQGTQTVAAQADCPSAFVIDFAGLPAGTLLGEQYSALGVHISAVGSGGGPNAAIVFDSNAPPTHDPDLAAGVGNIAILALNLNDADSNGLVDDPDENNSGGRQVYAFDQPVHIGSFLFIDNDHGTPDKAIAYDAANNVITEVPIPVAGEGSVQTIGVNADGVRRLEIVYRDSAGLTGIEFGCQPAPTPGSTPSTTPSPTPSPTPSVTASPSPSPTPSPTAAAPTTATPMPAAILTPWSATPAPTGVLAASLPAAGGGFGLREQPIWFALGAVTLALLGVEYAVLQSGRRR
jgi:hypothetical protein